MIFDKNRNCGKYYKQTKSDDSHMLTHTHMYHCSKDGDPPPGIRMVNFSPAISDVSSQSLLLLETSYQGLHSPQANIDSLRLHLTHLYDLFVTEV